MKKLLILLFTIALFTACNNNGGPGMGGGGGGWSSAEKSDYMKQCAQAAGQNLDEERAKKMCSCSVEKFEKKYPKYADMQKSTYDEGVEIGKACAAAVGGGGGIDPADDGGRIKPDPENNGDGWAKNDKNQFIGECQDGLTQQGYSSGQARKLCSCVVGKLEKKYASLSEANEKGGAEAGSSAMKKCVAEGGGNEENNDDNN